MATKSRSHWVQNVKSYITSNHDIYSWLILYDDKFQAPQAFHFLYLAPDAPSAASVFLNRLDAVLLRSYYIFLSFSDILVSGVDPVQNSQKVSFLKWQPGKVSQFQQTLYRNKKLLLFIYLNFFKCNALPQMRYTYPFFNCVTSVTHSLNASTLQINKKLPLLF